MRGQIRGYRRLSRVHAAGAVLLLASLSTHGGAGAADLSVYGKLPHIEEVDLSGDGSRLAFLRTEGDERVITVYNVGDHKLLRGIKVGHEKARWIDWGDADHLLITVSTTTVPRGYIADNFEWYQTLVFDVRDGSLNVVPKGDSRNHVDLMNAVLGPPVIRHIDGRTVLFLRALQTSTTWNVALVSVDLQTLATHVVQPARGRDYEWLIDRAGEIAADESYNRYSREWHITIHRDGHAREVAGGKDDIEYPSIIGWGPEPDTVLLSQIEEGDRVWRPLSLSDGIIGPPMAERKRFERPRRESCHQSHDRWRARR